MGKTSDPFYVVSHSSPNIRTPDALLLLTAQAGIYNCLILRSTNRRGEKDRSKKRSFASRDSYFDYFVL